jgi:hypothetical protein
MMNNLLVLLLTAIVFNLISCKKSNVAKQKLVFENIEPCCKDYDCALSRSKSLTFKNLKGKIKVNLEIGTMKSNDLYFTSDTLQQLTVTEEQLPNYKYQVQGNYIIACNMPEEIKLSKKDLNVCFDARFLWTSKFPANCECAYLIVELLRIEILK